jgi:hypothetical protein
MTQARGPVDLSLYFIAVFQRALTNDLLLASYDDLIKTLIGKCDFERRKINWDSGKLAILCSDYRCLVALSDLDHARILDNLAEDSRALIQCIKDAITLVDGGKMRLA